MVLDLAYSVIMKTFIVLDRLFERILCCFFYVCERIPGFGMRLSASLSAAAVGLAHCVSESQLWRWENRQDGYRGDIPASRHINLPVNLHTKDLNAKFRIYFSHSDRANRFICRRLLCFLQYEAC